jgi:hypothetical protein
MLSFLSAPKWPRNRWPSSLTQRRELDRSKVITIDEHPVLGNVLVPCGSFRDSNLASTSDRPRPTNTNRCSFCEVGDRTTQDAVDQSRAHAMRKAVTAGCLTGELLARKPFSLPESGRVRRTRQRIVRSEDGAHFSCRAVSITK